MPLPSRLSWCRALLAVTVTLGAGSALAQSAPLPSWNDGAARTAILDFVERVTTEGAPDFVPAADRIAVFDNDGTLWAEKPYYVELFFTFARVKALASQHPEWTTEEPFASVLKDDLHAVFAAGQPALMKLIAATHADVTVSAFEEIVAEWIATARNPEKDRPFLKMNYVPMVELLDYLRSKAFKTFIVSGGGIDFMRPFTDELYGIAPYEVVGTSGVLKFQFDDAHPELMKIDEISLIDDGPGKPVGIGRHIGQLPIIAFGNSDGDLQMLQYTCVRPTPAFCAIIHHTDAAREWAYDRDTEVGRLDKALDAAATDGWTVVDMKTDWAEIFPPLDD